jgi:PKD repeat protein
LKPLKYKWDFDGNGAVDAETTEHEVTTSYKSKGVFRVSLLMQLSNGDIRRTSTVVSVPRAVFDSTPVSPVLDQEVIFDLTNLVAKPDTVALVLWDFNGDGVQDSQGAGLSVTHTFSEIGSYQVEATVQYQGGLQEKYVRPVTILAEQKQPFRIMIETEGDLQGSAPLGIVFSVTVETGVNTSSIEWTFKNTKGVTQQTEIREGQRVSYVFQKDGEYRASVAVKDVRGRMATKSVRINVLNPLQLPDVRISGIPKPNRNIVEGVSPLEVKLESSTNTPFITFRWEQENASEVFRQQETYHAIYDKEGTFQVVLIATDDQGRSQKFPMEIRVLPPRSRVEFTALPSTGIAPLTVSFDASQSTVPDGRITGFSWTFGDGGREEQPQLLGAKVSHRYEEEGTFVVVVRALTEDGRSFEARKTIVVRSPTLDACIFPSRVSGIAPMGVRFDASCSTGKIEKYLWNYGDGKTNEQAVATQDYVFMQPGTYKVRLEVRNGQGGVSEETVTITVRSQ